jgi:predicted rRNA methylase YqxC with S4 and FtsJ domains
MRVKIVTQEAPSMTEAVVQAVTRNGFYINESQARYLIGRGDVMVDNEIITKIARKLKRGEYTITVGPSVYEVSVEHSYYE